MQLIAIADTNDHHLSLNLTLGDILIHARDITAHGRRKKWSIF